MMEEDTSQVLSRWFFDHKGRHVQLNWHFLHELPYIPKPKQVVLEFESELDEDKHFYGKESKKCHYIVQEAISPSCII